VKITHGVTTFLTCFCLVAAAIPVTSGVAQSSVPRTRVPDLVALPPSEEGRQVRIRGEAIGEALRSDPGYVWVNTLDEGVAVGVHIDRAQADSIDGYGDYNRTGSIIEVAGTFNVACEQHGGDLDIHARTLRVIAFSVPRYSRIDGWKLPASAAALATATALFARVRVRRRESGF